MVEGIRTGQHYDKQCLCLHTPLLQVAAFSVTVGLGLNISTA